jgi:hypothetical protein
MIKQIISLIFGLIITVGVTGCIMYAGIKMNDWLNNKDK